MKNLVSFLTGGLLACVLLLACQDKKNFTLNGKIENFTDSEVYLITSGDVEKIDTLMVKNGSFSYHSNLLEPTVFMLNTGAEQKPIFFVGEAGKTQISFEKDKPKSLVIQGGPQQKLYNEFLDQCEPYFTRMDSIGKIASENEENNAMLEQLQSSFFEIDAALKNFQLDFLKKNGNQSVSAFIGANYLNEKMDRTLDDVNTVYDIFDEKVKKSYYGQKILEMATQMKRTAIGSLAPDFTLNTATDVAVSLSQYKGKITLLDFWASWCNPCRQENPNVLKAYNKFHNKGFEILAVSLDNGEQQWQDAVTKDQLPWQQVSDLKGWNSPIVNTYGIQSIPSNFLLDKDGKIIAKNLRGADLEKKLAEIIQ